MALTAHFPPSTPLACVGGNNAPKPGVVGIDALVGAYAQTGRLCPMVIGTMPETGLEPEFDARTHAEVVDLAYAMLTKAALQGRRFLSVDTDSMQMETALNHVHAARRFFGLESARESMKLFADMVRKRGGYDADELTALRDWVVNVRFKGRIFPNTEELLAAGTPLYTGKAVRPPALSAADKAKLDEGLALYLILRDFMKDINAVGGGWTNQLAWGSDRRGLPMSTADIAESLFNSSEDHTGRKPVVPFATENDVQGLLTMILHNCPLRRQTDSIHGLPQGLRALGDRREREGLGARSRVIRRRSLAREGLRRREQLRLRLPRLRRQSRSSSGPSGITFPVPGSRWATFRREASRGSPDGWPTPTFPGCSRWSRTRPKASSFRRRSLERVCHASDYTWPHTFLTFEHVPAGLIKMGVPANHIHMVTGLPRRRWQHFSDYACVLNGRWENAPDHVEGLDRPAPMLYRTNGGETAAKMMLAGRRL